MKSLYPIKNEMLAEEISLYGQHRFPVYNNVYQNKISVFDEDPWK